MMLCASSQCIEDFRVQLRLGLQARDVFECSGAEIHVSSLEAFFVIGAQERERGGRHVANRCRQQLISAQDVHLALPPVLYDPMLGYATPLV